jgi:hypothetical protein
MAPARTSARRAQRTQNSRKQRQQDAPDVQSQLQVPPPPPVQQQAIQPQSPPAEQHGETQKLFLDPMSGQPLQLYVEKDVENRDSLIESAIVSVKFFSERVFAPQKDVVDERKLIIPTAIWRRSVPRIQWRYVHSGYDSSKGRYQGKTLMSLFSRSAKGVRSEPLQTICREEKQDGA